MSKQRKVSWRRSDQAISEAFEIALAQIGIRFNHGMPYITIEGNKNEGPVKVTAPGIEALVHTHGNGEFFFYVEKVVFLRALGEGKDPITVQLHDVDGKGIGNHLVTALTHDTVHRQSYVFQLLGEALGFEIGASVVHFLWGHPLVELDEGQWKLTYQLDDICGVTKIEIWYSRMLGYTTACLNGDWNFSYHGPSGWKEV